MNRTRILGLLLITLVVTFTVVAGVSASSWKDRVFSAITLGRNEVPPVATKAIGVAGLRLTDGGTRLLYTVAMKGVENITAAHIHCAARGVNGPVGVTFVAQVPIINGSATAPDVGNRCNWLTLDDVVKALESGNAYVNVHTTSNPSGFIRGQVFEITH
jgi:hypothetical protein